MDKYDFNLQKITKQQNDFIKGLFRINNMQSILK